MSKKRLPVLRADYARQLLREEVKQVAEEIRIQEKNLRFYLTSAGAYYLKHLRRRATLMTMAISLYRRRLHVRKLVVDGTTHRFETLRDQAQFLWSTLQSPFCDLSSSQRKHVRRIYESYLLSFRSAVLDAPIVQEDVDLVLNGDDVITLLGCKPGPVVGEALDFLKEQVRADPTLNTHMLLSTLLMEEYGLVERESVGTNGHSRSVDDVLDDLDGVLPPGARAVSSRRKVAFQGDEVSDR